MKRIKLLSVAIFAILSVLAISSCDKEAQTLEQDIADIKQYLLDSNLTATETASGLHVLIEKEGSGASPLANSTVVISYKGYLLNGSVFDSMNGASSIQINLLNTIKGWQEGIPYFKIGGKGKLFIPSGLGYGESPPLGIPENAVLIFDIDLVDVL